MARNVTLKIIRTTKANLESQRAANGLVAGEPYLITDDGGRIAIGTAANAYVMAQVRGVSGGCSGAPAASQVILSAIAPYPITLTQANCVGRGAVAATASSVFTIKNNGSTIGTLTWAAAGTTATVSISSPTITAGSLITVTGPVSPDATLADLTILLKE